MPSGLRGRLEELPELTTNQKGLIAETAIVHEAVKYGLCVLRPFSDERYDLVLDVGGRFVRLQCKWARRRNEVVVVVCHSNRRAPEGFRRRTYSGGETDVIAAYCPDVNCCYFIPASIFSGRSQLHLRLEGTRNNQRRGIHWARDYEFEATLGSLSGP